MKRVIFLLVIGTYVSTICAQSCPHAQYLEKVNYVSIDY